VLRRSRIVFSAIVFILFCLIFIDFRSIISTDYFDYILYLQFVPSFINFYNAGSLLAAGFIIVLILTIVSGRSYCSYLCPLGIGQDLMSRIGGRFKKKFRRYGYKKPFTILRYALLAITLIVTLIWGLYIITNQRIFTGRLYPAGCLFYSYRDSIFYQGQALL